MKKRMEDKIEDRPKGGADLAPLEDGPAPASGKDMLNPTLGSKNVKSMPSKTKAMSEALEQMA